MNGLTNYFEQIQTDVIKVNNLTALTPDIINNPGVYNLITSKYNEALEKGIDGEFVFFNILHGYAPNLIVPPLLAI